MLVSAKHQHESAMGIHSSPPSWTHLPPRPTPLGCHRAPGWSSVSHSKFPLALCFTFGSVYVSMLSIPPSANHFSKDPNGNSLQYSCLENSMDTGVWWSTVHAVAKESDKTEWLTFIFLKKKKSNICVYLPVEDRQKY